MANLTQFPGVDYGQLGNTRRLPLAQDYLQRVMSIVKATDPGLTISVSSAGQVPKGQKGPRTGSERHDVDHSGHGHTSDFVLVRDGKPIKPSEDKALYGRLFQNAAAAGFTGLGHYAWGVHIGGGSKQGWGPSTTSNDLDPFFKQAMEAGWAGRGAAPTGPQRTEAPTPSHVSPVTRSSESQFDATHQTVAENPYSAGYTPDSTQLRQRLNPAPASLKWPEQRCLRTGRS